MMQKKRLSLSSHKILWLLALFTGWVAQLLFFNNSPGVSILILAALLIGGYIVLGHRENILFKGRNLRLISLICFFACMVAIRANTFLTFLNICAVIFLFCLFLFTYSTKHLERLGLLGYPMVFMKVLIMGYIWPFTFLKLYIRLERRQASAFRRAIPLLRGLLIAVPVLAIFAMLLSSADSFFASDLGNIFKAQTFADLFWRLAIGLFTGWMVAGTFFYGLSTHLKPSTDHSPAEYLPGSIRRSHSIGLTEGAIVLALLNVLFLWFAWVQFIYLFSGQAERTLNYVAYREYVRSGFFELLVVAVLAMVLILGVHWLARPYLEKSGWLIGVLSTLLIGLTLIMLVAAFDRMLVWEGVEYYINTQTRLYIRSFIFWLGLTFGWLLLTIWFIPERFAIGVFVAAMGFLITVNLLNPDADVARYNLARHDELSVRYLSQLSEDAVPTLMEGLNGSSGEIHARVVQDLSWRLENMERDHTWQEWPSFNLSRWQAYDLLLGLRRQGIIVDRSVRNEASK